MNKQQKILTLIFLSLFIATLIWFPWKSYRGDNYYCVFLDYGQKPDWFRIRFEWFVLAVIYAGLYGVLKIPRTPN